MDTETLLLAQVQKHLVLLFGLQVQHLHLQLQVLHWLVVLHHLLQILLSHFTVYPLMAQHLQLLQRLVVETEFLLTVHIGTTHF